MRKAMGSVNRNILQKGQEFVKGGDFFNRNVILFSALFTLLIFNLSYGQVSTFSSDLPGSPPESEGRGRAISPQIPKEIMGKEIERLPGEVSFEERHPFPFLISVTQGDTFVDVSWTPIERVKLKKELIEEPVSGYIVFYGTESQNYTKKVDVGDAASYRIRNLKNHTPYFFSVKAYTKSKRLTGFSNEVKATPKPKEELKSTIERVFSEEIPQAITKDLKQFGYDLFSSSISSFAPVTDIPVGPDYMIGPGDSFTISLWGRVEHSFNVKVDRNGQITLSKIGTLQVWGLTFAELKKYLQREFSKRYKGFHMNVVMAKLRTIRVFVTGEVVVPGSYTLSSLSTVYTALFAAGGPSKKGTMRNIKLLRNGVTIKIMDLYDFLLKGDKSQDERLQSGDTIFIPVIGPVVGITGNVKRPAIYEMKGPVNLQRMVDLAGGVTFLGYLQRIQLERVESHQKKVVADFDISESLYGESPQLGTPTQDGDLIKIFPILPTTQNIVYLEGHVKRPGGYEFKKGMKLLDLIPSFDQLLPEPYLDYAEIKRLIPPDFHTEIISFNLKRLLNADPSQNIELKEHDRITIYPRETLRETPHVTVGGEVQKPGKYRLLENMRLKDLIYKAGNVKRSAYLPEAEITRLIKTEKAVLSKVININLGEALKENDRYNILLKEDDYVFVRQIPEWYTEKTCTIHGEVNFPGEYSISKGERLSSVLGRTGGFTEYSYLKGAFFTRESARRAQEERLKGFIDRLAADILRAQIKLAEGSLSKDAAKGLEQSLTIKRELIRKTKTSQATGRVVIALDVMDKLKGSKYDLEMEDGDTLTIPPLPGTVNVLGSVYNPTSIVYTQGKRVDFYLNKVGGPTPDAEENEMYIVKADGSVISKTQKGAFGLSWDPEENRWISGGFMSARIEPGDSILVPSKVTRIVWKRELMDWTTILYQIAVTAGMIGVLY